MIKAGLARTRERPDLSVDALFTPVLDNANESLIAVCKVSMDGAHRGKI